jgi:hypothetical protein
MIVSNRSDGGFRYYWTYWISGMTLLRLSLLSIGLCVIYYQQFKPLVDSRAIRQGIDPVSEVNGKIEFRIWRATILSRYLCWICSNWIWGDNNGLWKGLQDFFSAGLNLIPSAPGERILTPDRLIFLPSSVFQIASGCWGTEVCCNRQSAQSFSPWTTRPRCWL